MDEGGAKWGGEALMCFINALRDPQRSHAQTVVDDKSCHVYTPEEKDQPNRNLTNGRTTSFLEIVRKRGR